MKIKKVRNVNGETVEIDEDTKKLYTYSNKNELIIYNAEIVENGKLSVFFTDYEEKGIVEDIEERLMTYNNRLKCIYAVEVGFNSDENDPQKEIYQKFVDYIKQNENKFFTKKGDFRKKFLISNKEIKRVFLNKE